MKLPYNLTTSQARIVNRLMPEGRDVSIAILYRALRQRSVNGETTRQLQQSIAPTISRANQRLKLKKKKIVPGVRRGAYRLISI